MRWPREAGALAAVWFIFLVVTYTPASDYPKLWIGSCFLDMVELTGGWALLLGTLGQGAGELGLLSALLITV